MQQRSLKSVPIAEPTEDQPTAPTSIRPAPDDQLQKLAMLEGSARLRVAEQRVRHGLEDPAIRVQASAAAPLQTARHPRDAGRAYAGGMRQTVGQGKATRLRLLLLVVAALLLGGAAALHWLR